MKTKILCVEGPDKSGKETQTKKLTNKLINLGYKTKLVEVPYDDFIIYKTIYWMLRNGLAKKLPAVFQFIQFLNKFLFQIFVLPFLKLKYDYIVFDRWAASSVMYGTAEGLPNWYVMFLYSFLMKPDVTVVLSGTSYKRPGAEDSYEKDTALQRRVREEYCIWAKMEPKACLIDNQGTIEEVHNRICNKIGLGMIFS